jgi:hypothetical protein
MIENLSTAQIRNLEIVKSAGGQVTFGRSWPKGLNMATLTKLVGLGVLVETQVESGEFAGRHNGYRVA